LGREVVGGHGTLYIGDWGEDDDGCKKFGSLI
jgi:hypothetical protein